MRLIDADALINKYQSETTVDVFRHEVIEDLNNAPTVEAVPVRRAHWIRHEDWEEEGGCGWECSECGMGSEVDYKFCMRCGARMDERKEE